MNLALLYLLLTKAMVSSFSGPTSLPVVRHDLVEVYAVLTDQQLEVAVAAGRVTPGPFGLYLVSLGYFVDGVPGACVGLLALITPAFFIIPMLQYLGKRVNHPRVRSAIRTITLAAAGLLLSTSVPMARASLTGVAPVAIAVATSGFLILTRLPTYWVVIGGAAAGILGNILS
ncbi:MAG TPA: chromate transporter [Bryobacteraceae bacterium]|jgi:chromate transporter